MHSEAYDWVARFRTSDPVSVLDLGGRDVNGSARGWFPNADYTVLDIAAGSNVDIVADAATWAPDREYDLVVCTEVFEHAERWRDICATAWTAAKPSGRLILTMAGPGRAGHSAVDGGPLRDGEYYRNVDPFELSDVLSKAWEGVVVDQFRTDVRAIAVKPR